MSNPFATYSRFFKWFATWIMTLGISALACGPYPPPDFAYCLFDDRLVEHAKDRHTALSVYYDAQGRPGDPVREAWEARQKALNTTLPFVDWAFQLNEKAVEEALTITLEPGLLRDTLIYVRYCIQVSPLVSIDRYMWEYKQPDPKDEKALALLAEAKAQAGNPELDTWLRQRYGFQVVRLATQLKQYDEAIVAYNDLVVPYGKGIMDTWAEGYVARAHFKAGRRQQALFIYAKQEALTSIKFMKLTDGEWKSAVEAAEGTEQKIDLIMLRYTIMKRDFSHEGLAKMLELAPKSSQAERLLMFIIHTIERYNMEVDHLRFFALADHAPRYKELIAICQKAAKNKKVSRPALWQAAAAYLNLLDGHFAQADTLITDLEGQTHESIMANQLDLLRFFVDFAKTPRQFSEELKVQLSNLLPKYNQTPDGVLQNGHIFHSLSFLSMERFFHMDKPFYAALLCQGGHYSNEGIIDNAIHSESLASWETYVTEPASHPLEMFLLKQAHIQDEKLRYFRVVDLLRREKYAEAARLSEGLQGDWAAREVSYSLDHGEFTEAPERNTEKLGSFAKTMAGYHQKLAAAAVPLEKARLNFTIGNILYSLKDESWPTISGGERRRKDYYTYRMPLLPGSAPEKTHEANRALGERKNQLRDQYHRAKPYYQAVIDLAADRELAAEACVLVSTCLNRYLYHDMIPDKELYPTHVRLAQDFADTAFYEKFLKRCPPAALFR